MAQRALRSTTNSPRASRHAKPTASYEEPSSDIDKEYQESDSPNSTRLAAKKRKRDRSSTHAATPKAKRHGQTSTSVRAGIPTKKAGVHRGIRQRSHKLRVKKVHGKAPRTAIRTPAESSADHDEYSARIVPAWSSLPYQILVQIFRYASSPLYDERTFQALPSVDWLVKVSRLCRSFAEPALTNLYRSPVLAPMERAHRLCRLLSTDQTSMSYNYRRKVERLEMDVSQTAAYTLTGFGILDLHSLIYYSPRLLDLELYHQKDMTPYRNLADSINWSYPEGLIEALAENVDGVPTRLRSWRWSSRLAKKWPLWKLSILHATPSFNGLRKLAFVNYQVPVLKKGEEDPNHEIKLAKALSILPNLEHLIFESCELLNVKLLPLLPTKLRHFELINCWEVTSDILAPFLLSHGSQLRTITLSHNQSLNLSFLPVLKQACPHLTGLNLNLTYFNNFSSYRDSSKLDYDHLLLKEEKPSWPSTLQSIELIQLRNWDLDTADMFFHTLVDSARELPDLRRLVIKAILNTSWRDRVSFRDKWMDSFERIFKRTSEPPNPYLRSMGAFEAYKRRFQTTNPNQLGQDADPRNTTQPPANVTDVKTDETPRTLRSSTVVSRRRGSWSEHHGKDEKDESKQSMKRKDISARSLPRELRIRAKSATKDQPFKPLAKSHSMSRFEDSDSDNEPLAKKRKWKGKGIGNEKEFVQGMCDVVDIRIDNLRPSETQFEEADFLDSEPEGDEDWDGGEEDGGRDYAW